MQYFKPFLFTVPIVYAATHEVEVGESGLTFDPQTVTAAIGDTIIFKLYNDHDVAQGDFSKPCQPFDNGFYSGPFSGTDNGAKKFVINVTSTDPVYYYCTVPGHCEGGMVGGINLPSSGNTIDAYASAAKNGKTTAPPSLSGGQLEDDSQLSSLTASGSASATASGVTTSSGSSAATTTAPSGSGTAAAATSAKPTSGAGALRKVQGADIIAAFLGAVAWLL